MQIKKPSIVLQNRDKADKITRVDFADIKSAINDGSLEALVRVFEYFRGADTQIGSEIFKRRVYVSALPIFCESENKKQNEFLSELTNQVAFKKLLFDCTAGIAYGFAPFIKEWQAKDGKILPKFRFIPHGFFNTDREDKLYLKQGINKIFVDTSDELWLHHHPTDSGEFITQSLMYKLVVITALKHLTVSKYMSFFDALSVPPLVVKSSAVDDEKQSEAIIDAALNLRANGVALFGKEDIVELLNSNVDKATFLDFIKYCDDSMSKLITGQILAGNSQANGTQALGRIHNEIRQDILRFDAMLLSATIHELLSEILALNFANVAPFKFMLDANLESDEQALSDVYLKITNMGYEIPAEFMEETFKIKGLKFKGSSSNIKDNNAANNNKTSTVCCVAADTPQCARSGGCREHNSRSQGGLSSPEKLPIDKFDVALAGSEFSKNEKDILKDVESSLNSLLNKCESYEQAFEKLAKMYKEINTDTLETVMFNAIANAQIYGYDE
ncbi:DUF935 family protein [Campylobacter sp. RM12920]|uniref:DUF935 family protein n=1 Tax=Campylobacter californiensis TaxID=1032243 RepID=A0ABD4JG82_9BACT|nr:DUF935 family protein [Campylobacter sp. RM12919]MBE2987432.1 DUF935 family protein [Campylobacter sp. RM12920]